MYKRQFLHIFFFFKQKTAYEIMPSLVGSEMCIRDRVSTARAAADKEYNCEPLLPVPDKVVYGPRRLSHNLSLIHI